VTVIRETAILRGEAPDWRIAWEEMLTRDERREVESAVRGGRQVSERRLALFAIGLVTRRKRSQRWDPVLYTLVLLSVSLQFYFSCILQSGIYQWMGWCVFWTLLGAFSVFGVPFVLAKHRRRIRRAGELNERLFEESRQDLE
jgi:hypothetical protein